MKTFERFLLATSVAFVCSTFPGTAVAQWECPEAAATEAACGQTVCPENGIQATDALRALKAAVGAAYCAACRCDVDSSDEVTASDAARILRSSVGAPISLVCNACNGLTLHPVEQEAGAQDAKSVTASPAIGAAALPPQWFSYASLTLPDGRIAQVGRQQFAPLRARLLLLDGSGELMSNSVLFENAIPHAPLNCTAGTTRCAIRWTNAGGAEERPLRVTVFDVDDVSSQGLIVVKTAEEEYLGDDIEVSTGAGANAFACDESGACVSAWILSMTTIGDQDQWNSESLGYYARAFNVHTGEIGPEMFLADTDALEARSPSVEALGDDLFRVTLPTGEVFDFDVF